MSPTGALVLEGETYMVNDEDFSCPPKRARRPPDLQYFKPVPRPGAK